MKTVYIAKTEDKITTPSGYEYAYSLSEDGKAWNHVLKPEGVEKYKFEDTLSKPASAEFKPESPKQLYQDDKGRYHNDPQVAMKDRADKIIQQHQELAQKAQDREPER